MATLDGQITELYRRMRRLERAQRGTLRFGTVRAVYGYIPSESDAEIDRNTIFALARVDDVIQAVDTEAGTPYAYDGVEPDETPETSRVVLTPGGEPTDTPDTMAGTTNPANTREAGNPSHNHPMPHTLSLIHI